MLDVPEHLQRVVQGHEEIIKLVWPFDVWHNHFENIGEERAHPVKEAAASRFFRYLLPVGHDLETLAEVLELTELLGVENVVLHDVEAMLENSLSQEIMAALMTLIDGCK